MAASGPCEARYSIFNDSHFPIVWLLHFEQSPSAALAAWRRREPPPVQSAAPPKAHGCGVFALFLWRRLTVVSFARGNIDLRFAHWFNRAGV
jgi:hypothetical protein